VPAVTTAAEPQVTSVRREPLIKAVLTELARFSRRNTLAAMGGFVGAFIIFVALAAPLLAPRDPLKADFRRMNKPPDAQSLLGTDQVGRDTLSRVIYGARTSLFVAFSAVILGTTVGSLWGVACGYLRGRFDLYSQRIMEIMQAFPDLILAMAISMAIGTGLQAVIFAIAITRIPFGGRVIRSVALSVREMPYVEAGRASGGSALRIMTLHVLPQCIGDHAPRRGDRHRGRARLPGRRRAAADADVGQHAGRLDHRAGATVVAGLLSWPGHHRHRARVQSAG